MDSSQRRHRRAVSTPRNMPSHMKQSPHALNNPSTPQQSSSSDYPRPRQTSASRIIHSVKRSLSVSTSKHRDGELATSYPPRSGVYSTPEERMSTSHHRQPSPFTTPCAPPTIQQIAMGLHVSRTPHLRPLGTSRRHGTPVALPPPPARSSMKKASHSGPPPAQTSDTLSSDSNEQLKNPFAVSSSTVTSETTESNAPRSNPGGGFSFSKFRMGRFLSGSQSSSAPSSSMVSTPVSSPRHSTSEYDAVQRKAVRFEGPDD